MSQTAEDVRDNIVKVIDDKGKFYGTGFLIRIKQDKYCLTCHHCICRLKEIYIERDNIKCSTEWIEEFSDMGKDIAILKVIGCSNIKPLKYGKEAMAQLSVSLWGYSDEELETFPQGAPAKKGSLSDAPNLFRWPQEKISDAQKWNKKPEVNVYVFQYDGKFHLGNSGAPVCYTGNNSVIGVFTAKDDNYGWVIPIQTILEKFEDEKKLAEPSPTIDTSYYMQKGIDSHNKGDYHEAIKQYDIILNDPNYVGALGNKGSALDELGRHQEALEYFDKALAIEPNDYDVLNNKGLAFANLANYQEALEYFDKALKIEPNYVYALNNKGTVLGKLQKYSEAIECFDKALALDPTYIDSLYNIGTALTNLKKDNEAIECFDKALALDPNNVKALGNIGISLNRLEKYKEAIEYADKALAIQPNDVIALNNKGEALKSLGRDKEAIIYFDKALSIDPKNVRGLSHKALILCEFGKYTEAIEWYDKALAINPNHLYALYNKGNSLSKLEKYEEAIECYDKALAINPNHANALKNKEIALNKLKEKEQI